MFFKARLFATSVSLSFRVAEAATIQSELATTVQRDVLLLDSATACFALLLFPAVALACWLS